MSKTPGFNFAAFVLLLLILAVVPGAFAQAPAGAAVITDIHKQPNWESCTVCAGRGGDGPSTNASMDENVSSPSLSGGAARFSVGDTSWGASLWWKQIGGNDAMHHFVYKADFFMPDPGASQAIEFDMNVNAEGKRYIFGTECTLKEGNIFRVWDYTRGWVSTNVPCPTPQANTWNHIEWEFERTPDGHAHFVQVTLNGNQQAVHMYSPGYEEGGSGIDVAFQADLDGAPHNYSVYVDNVSATMWP